MENRLLASLPAGIRERIKASGESVSLQAGQVIYTSGQRITHIFFPNTCFVSSIYSTASGSTTEVGIVGNEGMVGSSVFAGINSNPQDTVIQGSGTAHRVRQDSMKAIFQESAELRMAVMKFSSWMTSQVSQTAACNSLHYIEPRLCRWLLMFLDRMQSTTLQIKHEFIAGMLGADRARITSITNRLGEKGAIGQSRGRITVVDRGILEDIVCECYWNTRTEMTKTLPWMQDGNQMKS